jgi:hypothetical protein
MLRTGAAKAERWTIDNAEVDYANGRFGIEFMGPDGIVVAHMSILEAISLSARLRFEIAELEESRG